jgi:hypothetical protein
MNAALKFLIICVLILVCQLTFAQTNIIHKDSIVYNIIHRDTIIYKYDTVSVRFFVKADTLRPGATAALEEPAKKRKLLNPNNWGIGPSVGAYYSPFHGFDINVGFGVQYYFLSIPTFKNPHMGHVRSRKK